MTIETGGVHGWLGWVWQARRGGLLSPGSSCAGLIHAGAIWPPPPPGARSAAAVPGCTGTQSNPGLPDGGDLSAPVQRNEAV